MWTAPNLINQNGLHMKFIKRFFLGVLILLVILLIIGLFIKKEFAVEREIVISKNKQEVFNYIKMVRNQGYYAKWNLIDPDMKKEYTGTDGTVGFISAWDSKNGQVGKGEQTITKIIEGERIESSVHFIRPFEAHNFAYMSTDSISPNQTRVKWGFSGKMAYPLNIIRLFIDMKKAISNDLDTGLKNLKTILEK